MNQTSADLIKTFQEFMTEDAKFNQGNGAAGKNAREHLRVLTSLIKTRHTEIKAEASTRKAAKVEREAARQARQAQKPTP